MGQLETSGPTPVQQNWRAQEWRDLICPVCHRTTTGPEGNTYCGWHAATLGNVVMEPLRNLRRR